jgi:hypothetical protein
MSERGAAISDKELDEIERALRDYDPTNGVDPLREQAADAIAQLRRERVPHEGATALANKLRQFVDPESRGIPAQEANRPLLALADEIEQGVSALIYDLESTYSELQLYVLADAAKGSPHD